MVGQQLQSEDRNLSPPRNDDVVLEMEHHAQPPPSTANIFISDSNWDWDDILDFTSLSSLGDTSLETPIPSPPPPPIPPPTATAADRIRKRDPRLTCENFLAGRVPCACPEIDEKLEQERDGVLSPGKKRVRVSSGATRSGLVVRCQVPGCEVDISELKGYHKRHRVCLRCANASSVLLGGEAKRYCQQCGKFHVLLDFDEGKRSCRRKLLKHNDRRRRKPHDSRNLVDKEPLVELQTEDNEFDGEAAKDTPCLSNQTITEKEALTESEHPLNSSLHSDPNSQALNSDSGVSFAASGETQIEGGKDDSKLSPSPSYCDNKTAYSSMCPTGRISFKLYDWNPAEFPRRLRHQIFQWLVSMPVELEGYIRPGCTILTAFIAMPTYMWKKLLEDPITHLHDLLILPGKVLSKKGPMLVYLEGMVFHVKKDAFAVKKVNLKGQPPILHYVHPRCFEAGKPMELVASGSNLFQPKFRFLVSFSGTYLTYDSCIAFPAGQDGEVSGVDHQSCKIVIPHLEPNCFGPAFIEVENESGLSNFIPVLIGDRETCAELELLQQRCDACRTQNDSQSKVSPLKKMAFSELLVDIAWLLKKPSSENLMQNRTSSQIQRINSLLNILVLHESAAILDKVIRNVKDMVNKMKMNEEIGSSVDADLRLLHKFIDYASDFLTPKLEKSRSLELHAIDDPPQNVCAPEICCGSDLRSLASLGSKELEYESCEKLEIIAKSTSIYENEKVPLLSGQVEMDMNLLKPHRSGQQTLSYHTLKTRPALVGIVVLAVCFAACAVIIHPHEVRRFAVSIRRCLTDRL